MIVTIDGNIGSGKSSLINKVCAEMSSRFLAHKEPVEKWEKFLEVIYQENRGHFAFQTRVWADCCSEHICSLPNTILLVERSPRTRKEVFLDRLLLREDIPKHELDLLREMYEEMSFVPHVYVYVRSDPSKCYERIHKRGRKSERNVGKTYIKEIHELHEAVVRRHPPDILLEMENRTEEELASELLEKLKPYIELHMCT